MRARVGVLFVSLVVLAVPDVVSAGGLEYTAGGSQALGRGGAVTARADDPMVLSYNPAGLAELRGNQMMFDANLALMDACVTPYGFYGWGAYGGGKPSRLTDPETGETLLLNLGDPNDEGATQYYNEQLDRVCLEQGLTPVPQVGFTFRVSEDFGFGFGLIFPSVSPQGQWGGDDGIIRGASGQLRPAPTRYTLLRSGTIGIFPTVGVGYRLTNWLRVGAAFEWGMIAVDNTSMAMLTAGTSPHNDIEARVEANDLFVPAATASVHLVPTDALDIVAAFRWSGDLAAPGTITLTTGKYNPEAKPHSKENEIIAVHQNFPWKLRAGIRYADRLSPRPSGTGHDDVVNDRTGDIRDPMLDELWDLEFDIEYQLNARNKDQRVDYVEGQTVEFETLNGMVSSAMFPGSTLPGGSTDTVIEKRWKNQLSLRAGGSYNLIPGFFAFSLGAHYETRGVDPAYMQLDYWPVSRVGLHAGIRFRIARTFDITASYAHIFQETLDVAAPAHMNGADISTEYVATGTIENIDKRVGPQPRGMPPPPVKEEVRPSAPDGEARLDQNATQAPDGQPPYLINSGKYTSGMDVFAIGFHIHY